MSVAGSLANDTTAAAVAARRIALLELALLLSVLAWVLWTDNKRVLSRPLRVGGYVVLMGTAAGILIRQRPDREQLGLAPKSWTAGLGTLGGFTILGAAGLVLVGWLVDTLGRTNDVGQWLLGNWLIDGAQQILLQVVLVPRLTRIIGGPGPKVSVVAAAAFGMLHAPNLPLMVFTAPAAFVWCEWFRQRRNLPAVWVSHMILAAAALYCLNGPAVRRLRVGISYIYHSLIFS